MIHVQPVYGEAAILDLQEFLFARAAGYNCRMTQKVIHRIAFYATGAIASLAGILYVRHWAVVVILVPGGCLALQNLRAHETEISELNMERDDLYRL